VRVARHGIIAANRDAGAVLQAVLAAGPPRIVLGETLNDALFERYLGRPLATVPGPRPGEKTE
jgi:hypothetical protein